MFKRTLAFTVVPLVTCGLAIAADPSRTAPVPTQIGTARRVFISNMGGECQNFTSPGLSFGAGQPLHHGQVSAAVPTAYDALYAALQTWGRFELVLAPADADLVFQIHVACPSVKEGHPAIDLQILDPKTRIALWGFNENADPAELQRNRDNNFERALDRLTQDLKELFNRAGSASLPATH